MRIALIADTFPPLRTSGAVQLRDLSLEFVRQGHAVTVMLPSADLDTAWAMEDFFGVQVLRLRAEKTKDINYVSRTLNEFLMPFYMLRNLRKSPLAYEKWDGVVWYAPSIFFGPMVNALKKACGCRSYLIVRDIFPEWAVDMGLMGRGLPYRVFKAVEKYQYSVANVIGVQTPGNLPYLQDWMLRPGRRADVLQNWLAPAADAGCSIRISDGPLVGRKVFVYAGNMGVAQGMDVLLDLAERMLPCNDIGFLFVGRGSDAKRLRQLAEAKGLNNVVFHDEIDPSEIAGLYAQCHVGLVALDPRHKTHNIPGKFLSYMQSGLPVLACVNAGNDLVELIHAERVGHACVSRDVTELELLALQLVDELTREPGYPARCKTLASRLFSPAAAVQQVVHGLVA